MDGRLSREVEFEFVDDGGKSGGAFVATGQVRAVILRHLTKGEYDAAATLIATSAPELGDTLLEEDARDASLAVRAAMAEMFFRARDYARAGRAALMIGDPARAAPFFERSYQFARAAELYEQAGQIDRAAELLERDLKFERAAQLYEQKGHLDRAAEAYEKAGKLYDSGRLFAKLRRLDRAVEVLQKVPRESERYVSAVSLLGRVLEHAGHRDAAVVRYIELVKTHKLNATTVDVFERLAEIYLAAGEKQAAKLLFSAVASFDPKREKTQQGLAALGVAPPAPKPSQPSGQPVGKVKLAARPESVPARESPKAASLDFGRAPDRPALSPPSPGAPAPGSPPLVLSGASAAPELPPLVLPAPPGGAPAGSQEGAHLTAVHTDVDALRNLPLLSELSLDELRALCAIGQKRTYAPEETLIDQDRPAEAVLVVLAGTVTVAHVDASGETPLGELGFGAPLGEMALIDEGPTSARVRAKTQVTAFVWPIDQLRHHLSTQERTALRILRVMSRTLSVRLRETNRRVRS